MSPLIQKETETYRKILGLLLVLAMVTVSGCLGLLWLRQKIELSAQATRSLEAEIVKEERRLRYVDTKIAEIQQPANLERQIRRLDLNLRPPAENQVVYMEWFPHSRSRSIRTVDSGQGVRERDPYRHSIDLAVMDSLIPID